MERRHAVLVVEDEVLLRMMMSEELRGVGYSVIEAANAQEALDVLHSALIDVKLLITDVRMPGSMDGVALARCTRSESPATKIVLISGDLPAADTVEYDGFFSKPYDVARIVGHIRSLVKRAT
jgi:CheY-like chemotaxis protein